MKKVDVFVALTDETTPMQPSFPSKGDLRKKTLALKKQFQQERRVLIDALFTHLRFNRVKELPLKSMTIDFPLYRGIGPSRAAHLKCMYSLIYDELAKSLPNPSDRLHAALGSHNVVAVTISDAKGDHEDTTFLLQQQFVEHRIENAFGREIREHFEVLFDSRPKTSPFLIPVAARREKDQIVEYLHRSQRVRTQCSWAGFRNIETRDQRGVVLLR